MGNFVEWFDFTLYGFTAAVIAATFFPAESGSAALLGAFAIYGVAFVARPLGAVVFGHIGDRAGRRFALTLSILLMGGATAAMGLLPGWSSIGVAAPILLLVCRLVQGFSAGGEYTGALTFSTEHAPKGRRAFWMGFIGASTSLAAASATLTVVIAQLVAGPAFAAGGWRWAFVIGGLLSLVAFFLRLGVDETPVFEKARSERAEGTRTGGFRVLFRDHWRPLLVIFTFFSAVGLITHMFLGYLPTYIGKAAGVSSSTSLFLITGVTLAGALLAPVVGLVIDRWGRRPILRIGFVSAAIGIIPAYLLMGTGSIALLALALLFLFLVVGLVGAGAISVLEMLPAAVRFSGVALPYNVAYAVFGGTAPLVSQALVEGTGSLLAPAFYATAVVLIALPILLRGIPETKDSDLVTGARS